MENCKLKNIIKNGYLAQLGYKLEEGFDLVDDRQVGEIGRVYTIVVDGLATTVYIRYQDEVSQ